MSFHIKDDFKSSAPISQVPASWFNAVAKFINGIIGGWGIKTKKNEKGDSIISIDKEVLDAEIENMSSKLKSVTPAADPTDGVTADQTISGDETWNMGAKDLKVLVVTRVDKPAGQVARLFFREMYIAASGHVIGLGAESSYVDVI